MGQLTSQQANQLSDNILNIAKAVGDFRFANWKKLSSEEKEKLGDLQDSLLNAGEDILALSVSLVMEEVSDSLNTIQSVTAGIKATLRKLESIQTAINIAAAAVALSADIIKKDPKAIAGDIKGIAELVKTNSNTKKES